MSSMHTGIMGNNDIIMNTDKNNNPNSSNHMKDNDVALVVGNDEESKTITMTTTMVTVHTMLRNATSLGNRPLRSIWRQGPGFALVVQVRGRFVGWAGCICFWHRCLVV